MKCSSALLIASLLTLGTVAGVAVAETDSSGRTDGNVSTLSSQERIAGTVDDVDDLRAARSNGTLAPDESIIAGDTLVVRIRSEHVNESFAETDGANTTDRFFGMTAESDTNVSVRAIVGPERQPFELALERSDARVVRDGPNATFYVVVDTASTVFVYSGTNETLDYDPGFAEFEITVEAHDDGAKHVVHDGFEFEPPDATVQSETEGLWFGDSDPGGVEANTSTLALSGRSNVLPGTNVTVRAVDPNGTTLATSQVTTTENASREGEDGLRNVVRSDFTASVTDVPTDEYEWFELRAEAHNRTFLERRLVVGPPPRWSNLSAEVVETDGSNPSVRVNATLRLPARGLFSADLNSRDSDDTRWTAVPAGRSHQQLVFENVSGLRTGDVEVEVRWDANGNGEFEFPEDRVFQTTANVTGTADDGELDVRLQLNGSARVVGTRTGDSTQTSPQPSTTARPETSKSSPETTGTVSPSQTAATDARTERTSVIDATATDATATDGPGFGIVLAIVALAIALAVRFRSSG